MTAMPPLFNKPLPMPGPDFRTPPVDHTDGSDLKYNLRLSEPCPVKRVVYAMAPENVRDELYGSFNMGVATLGHLLAAIWIHESFAVSGEEHYPESEIMWTWGVSHDDCFVPNNGQEHWGLHEIKTTSKKRLTPSPQHYDQIKRRMYAMHLQGVVDVPGSIVIIGKSGNAGGIVGDHFPVSLTSDDVARFSDEWSFVDDLMDCVIRHGTLKPIGKMRLESWCCCGQCFPAPTLPSSAELDEKIEEYLLYIDQYHESIAWYEEIRGQIKEIVGDSRSKYVSNGHVVSVSKSGSLTIKPAKM